jgi:diamine N-acetyltransferase
VAPVTHYLCLCLYEKIWHPLAVSSDDLVVGHVMWALDADEGSHWIGGLVVDAKQQGRGIGGATVTAVLDLFAGLPGHVEAALSYHVENDRARRLYRSLGFRETGEHVDGEVVARRPRAATTPTR